MERPPSSKATAGGGATLPRQPSPPAHPMNVQSSKPIERGRVGQNAGPLPLHRAILENGNAGLKRAPRNLGDCLGILALALALAPALPASTINGTLRDTQGNAYATNALFVPLSTPMADGTTLIGSTKTNVLADGTGAFSLLLKQGNYKVTLGNVAH